MIAWLAVRRLHHRESRRLHPDHEKWTAQMRASSGRLVLGERKSKRRAEDLVAFMENLALAYPKGQVHPAWL